VAETHFPDKATFAGIRSRMLAPERGYFRLAIFFSAVVSLLGLAVPISIQMLIDQVANTAMVQPVIVLAATLFVLLLFSALFYSVREYVLELYERRIYARFTSEITLKVLGAPSSYFEKQRRDDLINRYFDIMTVQNIMPSLLVGLFSFFFQAIIGFAVTSLYHPVFLMFNIVMILMIFAIWRYWAWKSTETAFHVSESKYNAVAWVEGLTHQTEMFKAGPHAEHALNVANNLVESQISKMRTHFKYTFHQLIAFLLLYAASASLLLGLGGWLVIQGELTLGQLVAAELILSSIFASFGSLAGYLGDYYKMSAALEELDRISKIPEQTNSRAAEGVERPEGYGAVTMHKAVVSEAGYRTTIDLQVAEGSRNLIRTVDTNVRRSITRLLKLLVRPVSGTVQIDRVDLRDWPEADLHEEVVVLDRASVPQLSIAEMLKLAKPDVSFSELDRVLQAVKLADRVNNLPETLETIIAPSGWPFTTEEMLRLKLAATVLDSPRLLVLTDLYDQVEAEVIRATCDLIEEEHPVTLLVCSDRHDMPDLEDIGCAAESSVDARIGDSMQAFLSEFES